MTEYAFSRYEQFETSPEMIEQELLTWTDRFKENYSIDIRVHTDIYYTYTAHELLQTNLKTDKY